MLFLCMRQERDDHVDIWDDIYVVVVACICRFVELIINAPSGESNVVSTGPELMVIDDDGE